MNDVKLINKQALYCLCKLKVKIYQEKSPVVLIIDGFTNNDEAVTVKTFEIPQKGNLSDGLKKFVEKHDIRSLIFKNCFVKDNECYFRGVILNEDQESCLDHIYNCIMTCSTLDEVDEYYNNDLKPIYANDILGFFVSEKFEYWEEELVHKWKMFHRHPMT